MKRTVKDALLVCREEYIGPGLVRRGGEVNCEGELHVETATVLIDEKPISVQHRKIGINSIDPCLILNPTKVFLISCAIARTSSFV